MLILRAITALTGTLSLFVSGWAGTSFRDFPTNFIEVPGSAAPASPPPTTTTTPPPVTSTLPPVQTSTTVAVTLPAEPEPEGIDKARCPDMWRVALAAGFTEDDLPKLDRIVWEESNCLHDVVSRTSDYGWAQINWAAHGHRLTAKGVTRDDLLDPYTNMVEALWIADYAEANYGCRWQPWYMSGDWC
jgi:hypothetical protein